MDLVVVLKKRTNTGVFLPRRYGNPPNHKKKQGCSTILSPAKVVKALNLDYVHFHPRHTNRFSSEYELNADDILKARTEVF
ncbi:hypothetical protein K2173_026556 [Erythroxylum novogranatense]|uniref:Uncharacterized protein n=1 Tax=Erythroxylum novogranatense TaxID=1862640 RepID=A0AAV8TZ95_9ROSI|nr:hypothetical protein K2173_026556 [Erythroxylum novogranatense]